MAVHPRSSRAMGVRLSGPALVDLQAAAAWYEDRQRGLGIKFIDEFEALLAEITSMPGRFSTVYGRVRRARFRRFPYGVLFQSGPHRLHILRIFHVRRKITGGQVREPAPAYILAA